MTGNVKHISVITDGKMSHSIAGHSEQDRD